MKLSVIIIDRSNLDEVVCIVPVGHKDNPTDAALKITRREDLERRSYHRTDVVIAFGARTNQQYTLDVSRTGFAGDLWLLDILSDEQIIELDDIAKRMLQNALDFPPAGKLIVGLGQRV